MSIRQAVLDFVNLGPLPDSTAEPERVALHQVHLQRFKRPISDEEAELLLRSFGSDDCYGLAWTLLHLIESAPGGIPLASQPAEADNEWLRRLWARSHR